MSEEKKYYEYENSEKGIDLDLCSCLEENPQEGFTLADIDRVLAVSYGEKDESDWVWIIRLNDKRLVYLQGGCDYTGWDCQSDANSVFVANPEDAISQVKVHNPQKYKEVWVEIVQSRLIDQLASQQKAKTWRERMNKEFGIIK